jgi:hypothetical protein
VKIRKRFFFEKLGRKKEETSEKDVFTNIGCVLG